MSEAVPTGQWTVAGCHIKVVKGGKHGPLDRVIRVDGHQWTFDDYLIAIHERSKPDEVLDAVRRFFHHNEDVAVAPGGMGAGMLRAVEDVQREYGTNEARNLLAFTLSDGFRRKDLFAYLSRLASPPGCCERCKGTPAYPSAQFIFNHLCHRCWWHLNIHGEGTSST